MEGNVFICYVFSRFRVVRVAAATAAAASATPFGSWKFFFCLRVYFLFFFHNLFIVRVWDDDAMIKKKNEVESAATDCRQQQTNAVRSFSSFVCWLLPHLFTMISFFLFCILHSFVRVVCTRRRNIGQWGRCGDGILGTNSCGKFSLRARRRKRRWSRRETILSLLRTVWFDIDFTLSSVFCWAIFARKKDYLLCTIMRCETY